MFDKRSRYRDVPTASALNAAGREVAVVRLRRLPVTRGEPLTIKVGDQLDVLAEARYADGAGFWRIADANTELEASTLVVRSGRRISVPKG